MTVPARLRSPTIRELCPPETLHGAWLVSPHPHARITSLEPRWARDVEGVAAVVTATDLAPPRRALLRSERVRCAGDPVCVVAASDPEAAAEAVERVDVQYEGLDYLAPVPALAADSTTSLEGCEILDRWEWRRGSVPEAPLSRRLVRHLPVWSRRAFEPTAVLVLPEPGGGLRVHSSAVDSEGRFGNWLRGLLGASGPRLRLEAAGDGCPSPRRSSWELDGMAAVLALETRRPVVLGAPPAGELSAEATPLGADRGCQLTVELDFGRDGRPISRRVRAIVEAGAALELGSSARPVPALAEYTPFPNEEWEVHFVASHRSPRIEARETLALIDHVASNLSLRAWRSAGTAASAVEGPGWQTWREGPFSPVPLTHATSDLEVTGVGRSLGRWGTGWIAHEVALRLDVLEARPRVSRWRVRNASDADARSIRSQIAAEVDWIWRQPGQDLLEHWPTSEGLPEILLSEAEGSRGLEEAGTLPGAAAAAYLDALHDILVDRMPTELPLTPTRLFELLHPAS